MASDSLRHQLFCESEAMASYALSSGMMLPDTICEDLAFIADGRDRCCSSVDIGRLALLHSRLAQLVHPAKPNTLRLLRDENNRHPFWRILGPLPSVRRLVGGAVAFGGVFILTSISPSINSTTLMQDIYSTSGVELLVVLTFLLASAGLGASFNVLYMISQSIAEGSYDPRSESFSWISIALGLMAGLLLCELVPTDFTPETNVLVKPTIALLGGFSASLLHRVLGRLVETVGNLFEASSAERLRAQEQELRLRAADQARLERTQITSALVDALGKVHESTAPDQTENAIRSVLDRLDGRRPPVQPPPSPARRAAAPADGYGAFASAAPSRPAAASPRPDRPAADRFTGDDAPGRAGEIDAPRQQEAALLERLGVVALRPFDGDRKADGDLRARSLAVSEGVVVPTVPAAGVNRPLQPPGPEPGPGLAMTDPSDFREPLLREETIAPPVLAAPAMPSIDVEALAAERLALLDIAIEIDPDSGDGIWAGQRADIDATLTLLRQRRTNGANGAFDRDASLPLRDLLNAVDPVRDIVTAAGDAFAAALQTAEAPMHLIDALALAAAQLDEAAFRRFVARMLNAPFTLELVAIADLTEEEIVTAITATSLFASVYAEEIEAHDLGFLTYLAREAVDGEVEEFWHAESRRFEDREGFIDGLAEFQAALLDQLVRVELPAEVAARAGGIEALLATIDTLHAEPQARTALDRLTVFVSELREKGFDVAATFGPVIHR